MNLKQTTRATLIAIALGTLTACGSSEGSSSQTNEGGQGGDGANSALPKTTTVFGIPIRATADVDDSLVLHAAAVMAEYLDNDEDGTPDNQLVVDAMIAAGATLVMARDSNQLDSIASQVNADASWQDLLADEVFPNGSANGQFDATYEEVLHLITHTGYASVYPESFAEQPGSTIADAMDIARGGQFLQVPASYPEQAWYSYDDATCDYACQVTEYFYWALTSMLGAQDFDGRLAQIDNEWRLNTRSLVQSTDTAAFSLLSNAQFALPTSLPDGNYAAAPLTVTGNESPQTDSTIVIGATTAAQCREAASADQPACLIVAGTSAQMYGVIGTGIGSTINTLLNDHVDVRTIVMMEVPGSMDDVANLQAGRTIHNAGLNTALTQSSLIASGGVDFFLAGVARSIAEGAMIGVHSWATEDQSGATIQGGELPMDHPSHSLYLDYYSDINLPDPSGFYFYTLAAATADNIFYMPQMDIDRFGMASN